MARPDAVEVGCLHEEKITSDMFLIHARTRHGIAVMAVCTEELDRLSVDVKHPVLYV